MPSTSTSGCRSPACRACSPRPASIMAETITWKRAGHPLRQRRPCAARPWRLSVFVLVVGGGKVGYYLAKAGSNRADVVAAVTGDDEDNLVICQMAKHHFDVPRTIARVNNPKNEELFK